MSKTFITTILEENCSLELLEKFRKITRDNEIIQDPRQLPCIKPGCDNILLVDDKHLKKQRTCDKCGTKFCGACRQAGNMDSFCIADSDANFRQLRKDYVLSACPSCKVPIEKQSGCNHMTCKLCSYEFCWICRGRYTKTHYSKANFIFGCPGMHYTITSDIRNVRRKIVLKSLACSFGAVVIPIAVWHFWYLFFILLKVILAIPVAGTWFFYFHSTSKRYLCIVVAIVVFLLGNYILGALLIAPIAAGSAWLGYHGCKILQELFRKFGTRL
jgi:hypothetical protein